MKIHVSPGTAPGTTTTVIEPVGWLVGFNPFNHQLVYVPDAEDAQDFDDAAAERIRRSLVAKGYHVELFDAA